MAEGRLKRTAGIPGDVISWKYEIPGIPCTSISKEECQRHFVPRLLVWRNSHFDEMIEEDREGFNLWKKMSGFSRPIHGL